MGKFLSIEQRQRAEGALPFVLHEATPRGTGKTSKAKEDEPRRNSNSEKESSSSSTSSSSSSSSSHNNKKKKKKKSTVKKKKKIKRTRMTSEEAKAAAAQERTRRPAPQRPSKLPPSYTASQFAAMTSDMSVFWWIMQKMCLIANEHICEQCGTAAVLVANKRDKNGFTWVCKGHANNITKTITKDSMFSGKQDPRRMISFFWYELLQVDAPVLCTDIFRRQGQATRHQ
jgi:hypothetical protein